MPKTHTVQQGECLASIAKRYGFGDWRVIYQHADNEAFRKLRPNPNVLLPGDKLAIPGLAVKQVSASTGQTHRFQVTTREVWLRLDVLDGHEGEGTQARYELEVEGLREPLHGDIGADGKLDVRIPPDAHSARLTLRDPETDDVLDVIELRLGALDPADTLSGARQRMKRLGFACPAGNGAMDALTESALRAFQRRYGLEEDGALSQPTRDKLEELVGV